MFISYWQMVIFPFWATALAQSAQYQANLDLWSLLHKFTDPTNPAPDIIIWIKPYTLD